ncbi:hypothetical protein RHODGE_RHODGE_02212 [Rhodoplanes serenus]|uniref:Copper resistance protein n=1 Tax=Rhodoplanes serenus TaxID=200615 RepID=A0A3S4DFH0_9BRAD|nr:TolC family protein [Rhodoplanes serenus]VCU09039.1 hypothetical protein RHODGE_RHODGE_02212 [Rhodoplanes serenus]
MTPAARMVGPRPTPPRRLVALVLASSTLGGCVYFSPDGAMGPVAGRVGQSIGMEAVKIDSPAAAAYARSRVDALLSRPLDADRAVQIALLNNRGLQTAYNALGVSEAEFVQASLPPNPAFGFSRTTTGSELEIERRVVANVLALITLPLRTEIARSQFEADRQRAIEATFRLAAETRRAYYRAVAARETVTFLEQARLSADAAADLMRKLGGTGEAKKLDQARAGAFYAEVSNALAQARLRAGTEREALTRLMGLWGSDLDFRLPGRLPAMPRIQTVQQAEEAAVRQRVDLIAARLELDAVARAYGLTDATRFISILSASGRRSESRDRAAPLEPRRVSRGFEVELQVPLFDLGESNVRAAADIYRDGVNRLIEKAVDVRSEARAAYLTYRASHDIATLYQTRILPLRRTINEQVQLEYNGMLIDVFELLTTARESIQSNVAAIAAKRDFFIAGIDFQCAIIGGGVSGGSVGIGTTIATAGAVPGPQAVAGGDGD